MAAVVNNGISLSELSTSKIPAGAATPAYTAVVSTQPNWVRKTYSIAKSTVEAAAKADTFDAIIAALLVLISAEAENINDGVQTYTVSSKLIDITNNQAVPDGFYTDTAVAYNCVVDTDLNIS